MKTIVDFKGVSKSYGTKENMVYALKDASFQIQEGEFIIILGPSGAGKSTILNLLGGMDQVTLGDIIIQDENITTLNEGALANYRARQIGFIFQFYNLIPTLTVYENEALMKESRHPSTQRSIRDGRTRGAHA